MELFQVILTLVLMVVFTSPIWLPIWALNKIRSAKRKVEECGPFTYCFKLAGIKEKEQTLTIFDMSKSVLRTIEFNDIVSYRRESTLRGTNRTGSDFYFTVKNHPLSSYSTMLDAPQDEEFASRLEVLFKKA